MKKVKTILKFIALFILIKIIFSIFYHFSDNGIITEVMPPTHQPAKTLAISHNNDLPQSGYHRYMAGYGVSAELPEDWHLLKDEQVSHIKATAKNIIPLPDTPDSVTSIAANANSDAAINDAIFRISFTDKTFTSDDLVNATDKDVNDICNNMNANFSSSLPKIGMTLEKKAICSIDILANKHTFIVDYQRRVIKNNEQWRVRIYHIPLNDKTVIVTSSYKLSSFKAQDQIEKVLASLRVD